MKQLGAVALGLIIVVGVLGARKSPPVAASNIKLAPSPPAAGTAGNAEAGKAVFQANCAMCHGQDAAGMMGMHPSLRGAVERLSREGVEVTIRKGRATQPPMPGFEDRLSDQEIADVVAYIASLPPGPRNFGPDGEGGGSGMMGRGMMSGRGRGGLSWTALLLGFLAVAAILVLVVLLTRSRTRLADDPRRLLDRRYAAGELGREEYLERRRDLET